MPLPPPCLSPTPPPYAPRAFSSLAARKSLAVSKDLRSKIGFRPEELLASVVKLYLNLFHADREGALVKAIVSEGRSFRPTLFAEAEAVIR